MLDPYEVLNVSYKNSPQEILASFKKLRRKYHPDRKTGDREKYDQIMEAYEFIVNNPQKYINVNDFINSYKNSEEEKIEIIKMYKKFKGNMRKIIDNLILVEDNEFERIQKIISEEIDNGLILYDKFKDKFKIRKKENKKAERIAKEMGIDLSLSLEDLLNRRNNKHDDMIKQLEMKYLKK